MSWFCEGLANRGHSVRVVSSRFANGSAGDELESAIPVARGLLPIPDSQISPWKLLARTRSNVKAVHQAVQEISPDVIFCGAFDGLGFNTYLAAISSGVPSLTWLGDTWLGQAWRNLPLFDRWTGLVAGPNRRLPSRIVGKGLALIGHALGLSSDPAPRRCTLVGTLSEFVLNDLKQSGAPVPPGSKVIPVTLHPAFIGESGGPIGHGGTRASELRALFVGRMEMLKGPDTAIRAVADAVKRGANVRLTFAGLKIDETRPELHSLAASLGIAERITWAGTPDLDQLIQLYRSHDVFLFPSRIIEGLGIVNVEAMACGLPVIGAAHSGSAEVIIPGKSGFRVDKEDVQGMGRHLAQLHQDRNLLESLSASAMDVARRFESSKVLDALESELVAVAGSKPALINAKDLAPNLN